MTMEQPTARLVRTFREAEELAADWMRWMGFDDARVTPGGPDEGIDVVSSNAVAQVKFDGLPSGRPVVQALYGVATAQGVVGIFFSLAGWTAEAQLWADRVALPLFRFTHDGGVAPANVFAERLFRPAGDTGLMSPNELGDGGQTGGGSNGRRAYAAPFTGVGKIDRIELVGDTPLVHAAVTDGQSIFWAAQDGLYKIAANGSGEFEKFVDAEMWGAPVAVANASLFCAPNLADLESVIQRIDIDTSDCHWAITVPRSNSERVIVTSDAVLVIGEQPSERAWVGAAWCYAAESGRLRWQASFPMTDLDKAAVAATDDFVFVGGVYCDAKADGLALRPQAVPFGCGVMLDARTGQVLWTLGDRAACNAAISGRIALLTIAEPDPWWTGHIAFDCRTGRELWRSQQQVAGAPSSVPYRKPVVGDRHVWLPGDPLICRDLISGAEIWSANFCTDLIWAEDRLLGSTVAPSNEPGLLYTIDPLTGEDIDLWYTPVGLNLFEIAWACVGSIGCQWEREIFVVSSGSDA